MTNSYSIFPSKESDTANRFFAALEKRKGIILDNLLGMENSILDENESLRRRGVSFKDRKEKLDLKKLAWITEKKKSLAHSSFSKMQAYEWAMEHPEATETDIEKESLYYFDLYIL